jgi:hypothetical protein
VLPCSWFESSEKKEKETFYFRKSDNMLRKGNYSFFGLEEKELGFEMKWIKKWPNFS